MKINGICVLLSSISLFMAGCGSKESSQASADTKNGIRTVELTGSDTMKYNQTAIEAKGGETLRVTLTNAGSMPKEVMSHNWILLKTGSDAQAYATAANTAKGYEPSALADQIVAKISFQGPKQTGEVTFTVPAQPGEYPYLCSFPGHYAVGMRGILTVR